MENPDTQLENLQNAMKRHPIATGLVGFALVLIVARIWGGSFEDAHKEWEADYIANKSRCGIIERGGSLHTRFPRLEIRPGVDCDLIAGRMASVIASRP